jgi:hypothetical protein
MFEHLFEVVGIRTAAVERTLAGFLKGFAHGFLDSDWLILKLIAAGSCGIVVLVVVAAIEFNACLATESPFIFNG